MVKQYPQVSFKGEKLVSLHYKIQTLIDFCMHYGYLSNLIASRSSSWTVFFFLNVLYFTVKLFADYRILCFYFSMLAGKIRSGYIQKQKETKLPYVGFFQL